MTPLDTAHAALSDDADDTAQRQYYARFAAAELFVPLVTEDPPQPETLDLEGQSFALAFDTEARLQDFAQGPVTRAVMPGRALIAALSGTGAGIGLNLGVADTAMLLPPEALDWIREMASGPDEAEARLGALSPPDLPEATVALVDGYLATLQGLGRAAHLVGSESGAVLIFEGVAEMAERGVAGGLSEALSLAGAAPLSVMFSDEARVLHAAQQVGLSFTLPEAATRVLDAPGSDPERPPKLR